MEAASGFAVPSPSRPARESLSSCASPPSGWAGLRREAGTPYSKEKDTLTPTEKVERACTDTIEESSSVDEVDARRKRPPSYRTSQCSYLTHLQSDTPLHFPITTLSTNGLRSNGVWYRERAHFHLTISRSFRLKPGVSHDYCPSSSVPAPLNEFFSQRIRWRALG